MNLLQMSTEDASMQLIRAIMEINKIFPGEKIMKIEFEDGSGYNFNFRLFGEQKDRFLKL